MQLLPIPNGEYGCWCHLGKPEPGAVGVALIGANLEGTVADVTIHRECPWHGQVPLLIARGVPYSVTADKVLKRVVILPGLVL